MGRMLLLRPRSIRTAGRRPSDSELVPVEVEFGMDWGIDSRYELHREALSTEAFAPDPSSPDGGL